MGEEDSGGGCACFPWSWFLSFGNRTQNSRVAGARPNHQPAHRGIWSQPSGDLEPTQAGQPRFCWGLYVRFVVPGKDVSKPFLVLDQNSPKYIFGTRYVNFIIFLSSPPPKVSRPGRTDHFIGLVPFPASQYLSCEDHKYPGYAIEKFFLHKTGLRSRGTKEDKKSKKNTTGTLFQLGT